MNNDESNRNEIDECIDIELDELKEKGFSKIKLIDKINKIPGDLNKLRYLRSIKYPIHHLIDGLFLKPTVSCHIPCHKPWIHGCKRNIAPEIDMIIDCEYYNL